jgi:hypothetical protein
MVAWQSNCFAQNKPTAHDTTYYQSFEDRLPARFYFSKKYTSFDLKGRSGQVLHYRPNTTVNMGIGATVKYFSLNLAYGFPFLNKSSDSKVKTTYLDMQTHAYRQKFTVDLVGQIYEGYYLQKGIGSSAPDAFYQRADIKVKQFGIAGYYNLNWRKFSFQAAMSQYEWQKKSAGSLQFGFETFYGQSNGDSAFVPPELQYDYTQKDVNELRYFNLGAGAGYAYTLVIARHYYILANLNGTISLNLSKESTNTGLTQHDAGLVFTPIYRLALGYNSERWIVAALWVFWDVSNAYGQCKGDACLSI